MPGCTLREHVTGAVSFLSPPPNRPSGAVVRVSGTGTRVTGQGILTTRRVFGVLRGILQKLLRGLFPARRRVPFVVGLCVVCLLFSGLQHYFDKILGELGPH